MSKGREALANYVFIDKYCHSVDNYTRRESKYEAIERMMSMHRRKFKDHSNSKEILALLDESQQAMLDNKMLPSMRALQNGGIAIEKNNVRIYNCAASPIDRLDFFKELTYVLLSGCGVGYSVIPENINKLPDIKVLKDYPSKKYMIADSIEGWSNSMGFLIQGIFEGFNVDFNYNFIRPEGSIINGSVGLAPGPKPLEAAHIKITALIDIIRQRANNNKGGYRVPYNKIQSTELSDICCFIGECVKSGGIRRSALICLFDRFDNDMKNYKMEESVGKNFDRNTHRHQVNITALIPRDIDKSGLAELALQAREFFEPGILLGDHKHRLTNPCQPKEATVIIEGKGLSTFGEMKIGDKIWSKEGWTTVVNKWSTGVKSVYDVEFTQGCFRGTLNHRIDTSIGKKEVQDTNEALFITKPNHNKEGDLRVYKNYVEKVSTTYLGEEEVFDITVDNKSHTYWTGGLSVSNCCEIALFPYSDIDMTESGFQFCNLSTMNMSNCDSMSDRELINMIKLATFIGCVQSSYTTFEFLGKVTEDITRKENLLGVSMTGIKDNDDEGLVKDIISNNAHYTRVFAKEFTQLIGVNEPARINTVKPEGSSSKVLATSSGVHRDFYRQYIQRITADKKTALTKYVLSVYPEAWEDNMYDPNGTTGYLLFPIETARGGKDTVEDQLDLIKFLQKNWVNPSTKKELCVIPSNHSVSNTVSYKDEDFDKMISHIHKDKEWHSGISFQAESNPFAFSNSPITPVQDDFTVDFDGKLLKAKIQDIKDEPTKKRWANTRFKQLKEVFDSRVLDWDKVPSNSPKDMNMGIACAGGSCDLD